LAQAGRCVPLVIVFGSLFHVLTGYVVDLCVLRLRGPMLVLWYFFVLSAGLELKATQTVNRAGSQQVLAPGDGSPLARMHPLAPPAQPAHHASLQELSGHSALSQAHPLDRMTVLKYVLLAGLAILLMNYAHAAYEQRKLRKTLLGLRFMRHAVERRAASELTALQRIAQEPQLVVRHFASEFTVHSSLKTGDEILVGKASKGATRRREGCIIAQCCAFMCNGLGGMIELLIPCAQLVPRGKKRDYVSKWMVAPAGASAEPAYVFKHEDQDGNSVVVQDVRAGSAKMTLGAIDIDPCSWEAAVTPSPGKPLTIRCSHVTDREVLLEVQREKRTVAVITRGITFKGFTHVKLARLDTYVDFGAVTSEQEKLMILAAAVYMA